MGAGPIAIQIQLILLHVHSADNPKLFFVGPAIRLREKHFQADMFHVMRKPATVFRTIDDFQSLAPFGFGIFNRLKRADTVAETESGFRGVPSGFANIKSKSVR